ncbi:hypothetical protein CXQ82_17800 [Pseudomonas sp. S09G 359]|nr:hypothetical protein CXQ82_17800 [Pseudomonas sp. S09G 359]
MGVGARSCGSGLARESCVSVPDTQADTPPSRASPLPQGAGFTRGCVPPPAALWCTDVAATRIHHGSPRAPPPCRP